MLHRPRENGAFSIFNTKIEDMIDYRRSKFICTRSLLATAYGRAGLSDKAQEMLDKADAEYYRLDQIEDNTVPALIRVVTGLGYRPITPEREKLESEIAIARAKIDLHQDEMQR